MLEIGVALEKEKGERNIKFRSGRTPIGCIFLKASLIEMAPKLANTQFHQCTIVITFDQIFAPDI